MRITDFIAGQITGYKLDDNESKDLWKQKTQLVRHVFLGLLKHLIALIPDKSGSKLKERLGQQKTFFDQIDIAWDQDENYYIDTAKSPWPIDQDRHVENFKQFLLPEYRVPENNEQFPAALEILFQLNTLYLYYTLASPRYTAKLKRKIPVGLVGVLSTPLEGPQQLASRLDYITSLLVYHAGLIISVIPEVDRQETQEKGIKKWRGPIKQLVIETFYQIESKEREELRTIPNRLCNEIIRRINLKGKKPPAKNTVEKYLREEDIF